MLILPTAIFAELWPWWSLGGQFSIMPSMRPSTSTTMRHTGLQASQGVIKNNFYDLIPLPGARWMPPPGKDISWQWIKDALPSLKQQETLYFTVLIIIVSFKFNKSKVQRCWWVYPTGPRQHWCWCWCRWTCCSSAPPAPWPPWPRMPAPILTSRKGLQVTFEGFPGKKVWSPWKLFQLMTFP